jgi:hypothetical protein
MRKIVLFALIAAIAACKKKEEPKPDAGAVAPKPAAQAPVPAPAPQPAAAPSPAPALAAGEVLGSGAVGSIDDFVLAIEPYLAAMGASRTTLAGVKATIGRWIGLSSWEGVDGARPIRFWFLNPKKYRPPVLAAFPTQKGKKVQTQGWAAEAVGEHTLVAKDASTIAALRGTVTQALASPAGVSGAGVRFGLSIAELVAAYEPEIEKLLGRLSRVLGGRQVPGAGGMRTFAGWLGRALLDFGRQLDRADAELDVGKDHARVMLRLSPRGGTGLAALLAAEPRPSPAAPSKLPGDAAIAVTAAYDPAALGKAFDGIAAHIEAMGKEGPTAVAAFLRQWLIPLVGTLRGDFTHVRRLSGGSISLYGTGDAAKTLAKLRGVYEKAGSLLDATPLGGLKGKVRYSKATGTHKGTKYDRVRVTYDYSKMPEFQAKILEQIQGKQTDTYLAPTKEYVVVTGGRDEAKGMRAALDRLGAGASGSLAEKPEFRELSGQLPGGRFAVLYFSFVDYLKSALGGLAGGKMSGLLAQVESRGYLGAGFSAEKGALRIDGIATRSQIESIRKLFQSLRPRAK